MERERQIEAEAEPVEEAARPRAALSPAPPPSAADVVFSKDPVREVRIPEPVVRAEPPAPPRATEREAPRFGPPPARERSEPSAVPPYITEIADAATQIVRGDAGAGGLIFGLYADGGIRCVDVDGARYTGKAESARARMREDGGTRAFTVQLNVARAGGLEATFTGGTHDGETVALQPLVGSAR
jgi:hypothetical protein